MNKSYGEKKMYCKEILKKLVNKYERVYAPEKELKRSIAIKFTHKEFPKYFNTSTDDYEKYNSSCVKLEDSNIIDIKWKDNIKGHIVEKVTLNMDHVKQAYEILDERPVEDNKAELLTILGEYFGGHEIVDKFLEYLIERIKQNKPVKQYMDISDLKDIRRLFAGCIGVLNNNQECYIRVLSSRIYKDTKILELYERRISKVIKDFGSENEYIKNYDDSIFELYNIFKNPRQVRIKGRIGIVKSDKKIDLGIFEDGLGIGSNDLEGIKFIINKSIKRVVTVENLTTFNTFECKDAIVVYTCGFNSSRTINLLKSIYRSYPDIEYLHWGDIDCGGFKIFNHQKQAAGINFKPLYMDVDTYNKFKDSGKPLTSTDVDTLKRLSSDNSYSEFKDVINEMLINMKKIEQESIVF